MTRLPPFPSATTRALRLAAAAGALASTLACGGARSTEPAPYGPPATMAFTAESRDQEATVGLNVPVAPVVVVRDADGRPVPQVTVRFVATTGSVVEPAEVRTDRLGRAAVTRWRLGTAAGRHTLFAETTEIGLVNVHATAVAGAPVELAIQGVSLTAGLTLGRGETHQLVLRGTDSFGNVAAVASPTFQSQDAQVAAVSTTGLVTGTGAGATSVVVRAAGAERTVPVTVLNRVAGISGRPFGIAVAPGGAFALVTRQDDDALTRVSLPQGVRGASLPTGHVPGDVAFSPDGATAYVMNVQGASMSVLNATTGAPIGTVPVPHASVRVRVAPDGGAVYALSNGNALAVVDPATRAVVRTIAAGGNGLAVSPSGGRVYVANEGGLLSEIDPAAGTVLRTLALGGHPQEVVTSADGAELWIANESGWVDVVSATTFAATARVPLPAGAFGMALSRNGAQLWASAPSGRVFVIDRASRTLARTVLVGGMPRRVAFDGPGTFALVANEGGWVDFLPVAP